MIYKNRSNGENDDVDRLRPPVTVHRQTRGGVAHLRLDSPPVNALGTALVEDLAAAIESVRTDPGVRCLVVHGHERAFSAGVDVEELSGGSGRPEEVQRTVGFVSRLQSLCTAIEELSIPTVAALRGAAVGGGLELALACDLRFAAPDTRLGLPEIRLGLIPGAGGTQRLTRLCGAATSKRLILTGELVDGREAHRLGLVTDLVDDGAVDEAAERCAEELAERVPEAIAAAKVCIAAAGTERGSGAELAAVHRLLTTPETRASLQQFSSRKKPE